MKRFLLALLLTHSISVFAYSGFGVCNHGKETLANVTCDGPSVLKQTMVNGNIEIAGTLHAEGISASAITVLGGAELANANINGQAKIVGALNADNTVFKKGVAVESDQIILNHTVINGNLIVTSKDKTPYVQLQCSSVIKGFILFDGKAGILQVTGDSLAQGKIQNGSTEFVKRSCAE